MQEQHHVNEIREGSWPRCNEVKVLGDTMHCSLALDRTYDLAEAYQRDVHLRFFDCVTDQQFVSFTQAWGPLDCPQQELWNGVCSMSLRECRIFQRRLKAVVGLLTAFKNSTQEREALLEFVEADTENDKYLRGPDFDPVFEPMAVWVVRQQFKIEQDIGEWIQRSNLSTVRSAIQAVLQILPLAPGGRLLAWRKAGRPRVEAHWILTSLAEALRWMVWYDEFTQHPLICCHECRKVFRSETAHARKYCSEECGHRVASREFQRKKRAEQRKRSNKHVTRKTR